MAWTKRDPVSNLVVLGDDEGNVRRVSGLLASVKQDTMYPNRHNYEIVKKDGDSLMLAGSASLSRQIAPSDVGKFLKAEFTGWGKSANGKFKIIDVQLWEGAPTPEMKVWPRWDELSGNGKAATPKATKQAPATESMDDFPAALEDEDSDDLPF